MSLETPTMTSTTAPEVSMFGPDLGPAVEKNIALDIVKRSVRFIPILIFLGTIFGGAKGAASTAFAIAIVLANFLLSAFMLSWAARISFAALGMAAMFGYLIRLGMITSAVLLVRNETWVSVAMLGVMIVVTHLALLIWEMRFVSISFSSPGVRESAPKRRRPSAVNTAPVKE